MTTHTTHARKRFYRRNLLANSAAFLVVASLDKVEIEENVFENQYSILAPVSGAGRFTTGDPMDPEAEEKMFVCQHGGADPNIPAPMTSMVVTEGSPRTTVIFNDNTFTRRIGKMKDNRCWAAIVIRGKSQDAQRPEIRFEPLDERTWLPTAEMSDRFKLPALGAKWPFHPDATRYAEVNPNVWSLMVSAAVSSGKLNPTGFPTVEIQKPTELNLIDQRAAKLRDEREAYRIQKMLETMPEAMTQAFLNRLASKVKA